jgi:hypothetical protein
LAVAVAVQANLVVTQPQTLEARVAMAFLATSLAHLSEELVAVVALQLRHQKLSLAILALVALEAVGRQKLGAASLVR